MAEKKKKGNFTYGVPFKVFLFLVLGISLIVGAASAYMGIYLAENGAYTATHKEYRYQVFYRAAQVRLDNVSQNRRLDLKWDELVNNFELASKEPGVRFTLGKSGHAYWSNRMEEQTGLVYTRTISRMYDRNDQELSDMEVSLYFYTDAMEAGDLYTLNSASEKLYDYRLAILVSIAVCVLLALISFVWLMCNAGHRRGEEGIVPGFLTPVPLEIVIAGYVVLAWLPIAIVEDWSRSTDTVAADIALALTASVLELMLCTAFFREFAVRAKLGKWWQNSLIYQVLRLACRIVRALWRGIVALLRELPLYYHVAVLIVLFSGAELIGMMAFRRHASELFAAWILEKAIVVPLLLYCALAFKRLQKGSRALADGDLSRKLDTKYLVLDFGQFGNNLNEIGDGISRAVEQRLRSERLKTELITNVSHDIKTPLTSVINYASLLGAEAAGENGALDAAKVAEYSEVLVRQSNRLKKLLDDLLEASKATTGSLEVNPAPCALGVLLTQAAGEYEAKFAERGLELRISQPEEEIRIMADGRHLWRVFDNLLGNICKYAQDHSRVYLNMERRGEFVEIVFRNMSKYELNISPQELEERFVRGDRSRNMEGNGLGLSIAKSLTELQNGTLEIVTDGDLFKVILEFPVLND